MHFLATLSVVHNQILIFTTGKGGGIRARVARWSVDQPPNHLSTSPRPAQVRKNILQIIAAILGWIFAWSLILGTGSGACALVHRILRKEMFLRKILDTLAIILAVALLGSLIPEEQPGWVQTYSGAWKFFFTDIHGWAIMLAGAAGWFITLRFARNDER